jgi:hypothetical protein
MNGANHLVLEGKVDMININLLSLSEIMKHLSPWIRYPEALFLFKYSKN